MSTQVFQSSSPLLVRPLIDVTVTTLSASRIHRTTATGTIRADAAGVSQTTHVGATLSFANSQTTQSGGMAALGSLSPRGSFADGCRLFVVPPVDENGNIVDCEIRPALDGMSFDSHFNASVSVNDNLFPGPGVSAGALNLAIGVPYRKAIFSRQRNLPLVAMGWKYKQALQFDCFSRLGFGTTAAPVTPLRILVYGDLFDRYALGEVNSAFQRAMSDLARGGSHWDPTAFVDHLEGFGAVSGHQAPGGGALTPETWTSLPNGPSQVGGTAVYRFLRQAYPAVATGAENPFFLSNQDAVGGASGQVGQLNDLGFDEENTRNYYRLDLFSNRPGTNQGWVGVKVGQTVLPNDIGYAATANVNLWPSGEVQPQRPDSNLFRPMWKSPFPVAVNRNQVCFFVTATGTPIPAQFSAAGALQDSSQVAVGGIEVVGASQ